MLSLDVYLEGVRTSLLHTREGSTVYFPSELGSGTLTLTFGELHESIKDRAW